MAIKKLDPNARFKLICEFDDAVIPESKEEEKALDSGIKDKNGDPVMIPSRYQQYLENLDESKLKLREESKPSYFHFRCLTNEEMATLQEKYTDWDVKGRRQIWKAPKTLYLGEIFKLGVVELEDENGMKSAVGPNEVGIAVMVSVGSAINLYTQFGKHAKK
jgi:hypothetical protein